MHNIVARRFMLRNVGVELLLEGGYSVYLAFDEPDERYVCEALQKALST